MDSYAAVFLENGEIYTDIEITDGKFVSFEDSWQKCYEFTIQKAETLPSAIDLIVTSIWSSESANTSGKVYFKWKYSDGFVYKSSGQVSAFTKQFIVSPQKGDLRILKNGSRFK